MGNKWREIYLFKIMKQIIDSGPYLAEHNHQLHELLYAKTKIGSERYDAYKANIVRKHQGKLSCQI